ncbi:MAG: sulfite exporter TauE/SafE family protein, partial [Rhodospirillaceae bacterium]|nr:sulfite exporter TauE/SafE family protein [Rhodospirillaceae bacterium]
MEFLPADIDATAAVALVAATFIGNIISGIMGVGGGIILLAVMATLMPAAAIIPIHGIAQLGANIFRGTIQRAHIDWLTFVWFAIGSVVGV